MFISGFSRIDTVIWPGKYLSVVNVTDEDGMGEDVSRIREILHRDRDSLDGVLFTSDRDPESIPGFHRIVREVRPDGMQVIVRTSGRNPASLDDLIGAGYVNTVIFRFDDVPDDDQIASMDIVRHNDAGFHVDVVLDPDRISTEDVVGIATSSKGHERFTLLVPKEANRIIKKKDLDALNKALKGHARNVRIQEDLRRN